MLVNAFPALQLGHSYAILNSVPQCALRVFLPDKACVSPSYTTKFNQAVCTGPVLADSTVCMQVLTYDELSKRRNLIASVSHTFLCRHEIRPETCRPRLYSRPALAGSKIAQLVRLHMLVDTCICQHNCHAILHACKKGVAETLGLQLYPQQQHVCTAALMLSGHVVLLASLQSHVALKTHFMAMHPRAIATLHLHTTGATPSTCKRTFAVPKKPGMHR